MLEQVAEIDAWQAFILALIQGLTEFLPISSSAHLILPSEILGWQDQGLAFDVAVHFGSLIAVILYFRQRVAEITVGGIQTLVGKWSDSGRLAWLLVLATVPAGLTGLLFSDFIEANLRSGQVIAITTVLGALLLAASDQFEIDIMGKQTHGSRPWSGIDPITVASHMILGLQNIISRETELTKEAAVITVGLIRGGVRSNIIPEELEMIGTIRTLDEAMQKKLNDEMKKRVPAIAEAFGGEATIMIEEGYPITYNDPALTAKMLPSLERAAGKENVHLIKAITGAEDFSFFQKEVPGLYFFLGGKPLEVKPEDAAAHHTPDFYIDESGLKLGVKAFVNLTFDYLNSGGK